VAKNFEEWPRVNLVQGQIPEVLTNLNDVRVAYLHVDLNYAAPEVAAMEFFWPRLVPGALILLDDYGFVGCRKQRIAADDWAKSAGVSVLSVATGQGLIVKPPTG